MNSPPKAILVWMIYHIIARTYISAGNKIKRIGENLQNITRLQYQVKTET